MLKAANTAVLYQNEQEGTPMQQPHFIKNIPHEQAVVLAGGYGIAGAGRQQNAGTKPRRQHDLVCI